MQVDLAAVANANKDLLSHVRWQTRRKTGRTLPPFLKNILRILSIFYNESETVYTA